jgi:hypothetical protein
MCRRSGVPIQGDIITGLARPHGMMEYWIEKLEGIDLLFLSLNPSLHYSNTPGKVADFLYDQQLTEILRIKIRKLRSTYPPTADRKRSSIDCLLFFRISRGSSNQ